MTFLCVSSLSYLLVTVLARSNEQSVNNVKEGQMRRDGKQPQEHNLIGSKNLYFEGDYQTS